MLLLSIFFYLTSNLAICQEAKNIQHLIIYTSSYKKEATDLKKYRTKNGLLSITKNAEEIFDEAKNDDAFCRGYESECYLDIRNKIDGVDSKAFETLFGLGKSYNGKIQDYAGLIRAYIRNFKIKNPSLKYVVLMGDPHKIPPRFTQQKKSVPRYKYIGTRDITIPTDFYYVEVFSKWEPTNRVNYLRLDTPQKEPYVNYPFARTFYTPPKEVAPNCVDSMTPLPTVAGTTKTADYITIPVKLHDSLISVGRIIKKPDDTDKTKGTIENYITRLKSWEKSIISSPIVIVTAGEDVGGLRKESTTFLKDKSSALDYRDKIIFIDPEVTTNKNDIKKIITDTRFNIIWPQGHGSIDGICCTQATTGNKACTYNIEPIDISSTKANGFLISGACEISGYIGTNHVTYNDSKSKQSFGEAALLNGVVGVYGNYLGGTNGEDCVNIATINSIYELTKGGKETTIGKALLKVYKDMLTETPVAGLAAEKCYPTKYQLLNRVYLGDPAAKVKI